jgi:hypothetical protein
MADEEKKPSSSVTEDALFVFGGLAVLVVVWYLLGGPGRADLKGLFLAPPAPLGSGEAYGPQFGEPSTTTLQSQ